MARKGVANVVIMEYTLKTRIQIIQSGVKNPILRWRRVFWQLQNERKYRHAIEMASGFEANGTPTFDAYGGLNANRLLYFDTRVNSDQYISVRALERRLNRMVSGERPLHLMFSGRLIEMKGALDLIELALELRRRAVRYHLTICGDGPLAPLMHARIQEHELSDHVTMRGVLRFADELLPFAQDEVDLFVACHKQGDPSCTYLETFSCGIPIAGYLNEAFEGILRRTAAGWGVPMHDIGALAACVAVLERHRNEVAERSHAALRFAVGHSFEETFSRRVDFFRRTASTA